ncbi:LON peptidase substrate-binding domain-containing protein [Ilumatobacter sp.]|uniref:LON peptidase substrate-binding domain-containing protein n=1 Tax=Ilumatobacter sp. TaxID=1967498 RepID=UPI003C362A23
MAVMAMFPLGSVLLPGGVLPLHVFEPRYRQMVIDCLQSDGTPEFGQTLITHGHEAGGGDERSMVGTVAQMVQVQALDAERYALVAVGVRRIKVNAWLPDDPYPVADVDDFPDLDPDGPGSDSESLEVRVSASHDRVRSVLALASELGDVQVDLDDTKVADDPLVATYHLASLAPIGPADRYRLLAAEGPLRRLDVLDDVLDDVEAMLKFRLS